MSTSEKTHQYRVDVVWTGNTGQGTANYRSYERSHDISVAGKPTIPGSSDPAFRGDPTRYNPEEMLVASISTCHMLWYLHLCTTKGIVVTHYADHPVGTMAEAADGSGHFVEVVLKPEITLDRGDRAVAEQLHEEAHHCCFIANSVNFPIRCEPIIQIQP
jgi:organic hydroperoxide reductase OsmC/OhrA